MFETKGAVIMKLERLQYYKAELLKASRYLYGEILFRLATEAELEVRRGKVDELAIRRELDDLRLKHAIALGALEVYAQETSFNPDEPPAELAHLAQITLEKIKKVNWLVENRPAELR